MNRQSKQINFEPLIRCLKCGRTIKANGHYIKHKSGTISFQIHNMERKCLCELEEEDEK